MAIIYKLTRSDNKEYIGTTTQNLQKRLSVHKNSNRFKNKKIVNIEILYETDDIKELYDKEKYFIEKYNTFHNGLNKSINGRGNHLSDKFTTLGFKYSIESKEKMKKSKINFNPYWLKTCKRNKIPCRKNLRYNSKLTEKQVNEIKNNFKNYNFNKDITIKYIKKSQINLYLNDQILTNNLILKNGKPISFQIIYSHEICKKYNVSNITILNILRNKCWNKNIVWKKGIKNVNKIEY